MAHAVATMSLFEHPSAAWRASLIFPSKTCWYNVHPPLVPRARTELTALMVDTACLSPSICCRFKASRSRSAARRLRPKPNIFFGVGRELVCLRL